MAKQILFLTKVFCQSLKTPFIGFVIAPVMCISDIVAIFAKKNHAIFREDLVGREKCVGGINKDFWPEYTPLFVLKVKCRRNIKMAVSCSFS